MKSKGFTLIELSIVLLVLGLIVSGLLMPLSAQIHTSRVRDTKTGLQEAKEALIGFALAQRRLPCPDTDGDGLENGPSCSDSEGELPWASLGLSKGDGWRRPVRYRADNTFSQSGGIPDPADTGSGLQIQDRFGTVLTSADPNAPVAILYSCGDNGKPDAANDADGTANSDSHCNNPGTADNIYVIDDYVADVFDDIAIVLSKNVLLYLLASAGKWP